MTRPGELAVRVVDVESVAQDIKRFRLQPLDGSPLPPFSGGSHIVVSMNHGGRRIRNPYSLMGSTLDRSHIVLATKAHAQMGEDPNARGNSRRCLMSWPKWSC